jgi:hypothetical protein
VALLTVSWALTTCESTTQARLRGPALVLAQAFPQPGDQGLRQAAAVPPLEGRAYQAMSSRIALVTMTRSKSLTIARQRGPCAGSR